MTTPHISVIICTRNRAAFLRPCLDSALRQSVARDTYEVVVVDNDSSDDTAAICRDYAARGVRYVQEKVIGLSRARNTGWREAKGRFVGYLDDDATADTTWLAAVAESFERTEGKADWVGGAIYLKWETSEPDWMNDELRVPLGYVYWGDQARKLGPTERLGGGNSFYPRARLEQLGGFDERLGRQGGHLLSGEETQLQKRIEREGGFLFYHPAASIHHFVPAARCQARWFYRRYFWGGVSDTIMWRTLPAGEETQPSPGGVVSGPSRGGPLLRLLTNGLLAVIPVLPGPRRSIKARIYISYVLGRAWGLFRS